MIDNTKEYILCAAIHFDDSIYHVHHEQHGTGVVICGYRHHMIYALKWDKRKGVQGFLTSKGRFVDRTEAMTIAKEAGQVDVNNMSCRLFSEDIY